MAAAATSAKEQKIAECLNRLNGINLGRIASDFDITGFITDYFLEDEDDEDEFVVDESEEEYEGKFCHELP